METGFKKYICQFLLFILLANMIIYVAPYKIQGFFGEQKCALDGLQITLEECRRFGKMRICSEPSFTTVRI